MSIRDPRTRCLTFRISDHEFKAMQADVVRLSERSVSELARKRVLSNKTAVPEELERLGQEVHEIKTKLVRCEEMIQSLLKLLQETQARHTTGLRRKD